MYLHSTTGTVPERFMCFGARGTAVQIAFDLRYQAHGQSEFVGYVSDETGITTQEGGDYPVISFEQLLSLDDVGVFVGVYEPAGRRRVMERLIEAGVPILGASGMPPFAHPQATVGEGSFVTGTTRLGHTTRIGRGSIVFADLVAHDTVIGDFVTVGMNSVILGHVQIGDGAKIGARAVIHNGTAERPLVIGAGAVIGIGAVVASDVAPGATLVAPEAVTLRQAAQDRITRGRSE